MCIFGSAKLTLLGGFFVCFEMDYCLATQCKIVVRAGTQNLCASGTQIVLCGQPGVFPSWSAGVYFPKCLTHFVEYLEEEEGRVMCQRMCAAFQGDMSADYTVRTIFDQLKVEVKGGKHRAELPTKFLKRKHADASTKFVEEFEDCKRIERELCKKYRKLKSLFR